jgi:hypothetical protein
MAAAATSHDELNGTNGEAITTAAEEVATHVPSDKVNKRKGHIINLSSSHIPPLLNLLKQQEL